MTRTVTPRQAADGAYDVLIVGAGFAGTLLAHALGRAGRRVLMLEAGPGQPDDFDAHLDALDAYFTATAKIPNAPFPASPYAPQPLVTDVQPITPGHPDTQGYFVQRGPHPFESTYTRRLGGTSLHWFGSCPRMLPEDFALRTRFGVGRDWPVSYDDLAPYYVQAERTIGVSANVEDQTYHGIHFPPGYVYPMRRIPPSYLDRWMSDTLHGTDDDDHGTPRELLIRSIPQARNSIPNPDYDGGAGYTPVGAVGDPGVGKRCMGNSSCLPICPIQARYNSLKTLAQTRADLLTQAVARKLHVDPASGRISAVEVSVWRGDDPDRGDAATETLTLSAPTVVLAANAVENAKLLLASGACTTSDQVGRNLMDHPALLCWGYAPQSVGAFRGPGLTSTLVTYRGGDFRDRRAAFVFEIGNWGWQWPIDAPNASVRAAVDNDYRFGAGLRRQLAHTVPRQLRVDLMTEQLPSETNRVTIDPAYRDALGSFRPVIRYDVDAYTQAGLAFGRAFTKRVFAQLGVEDHTAYHASDPGYFVYRGQGYAWSGVGHVAGTHRMGLSAHDSVVDRHQRAWDHDNLYLIGCGSLPTLGTSNPTLTMAALIAMTAERILATH